MGGACNTHGSGDKFQVRKLEAKIPLGRLIRRWEDNIRNDLKEVGWECVD
jgi:hypothetical protein